MYFEGEPEESIRVFEKSIEPADIKSGPLSS
jgi:hypothetical protein